MAEGSRPQRNDADADATKLCNGALYERTQILVGSAGVLRLAGANVFLVGTGGVGGHCAEALVRAGVGALTIVDHDVVSATNKNRQLIALDSTIGKSKVAELASRLNDVSASCRVTAVDAFLLPSDMKDILTRQRYDAVIDCIDSIECKVALLAAAVELGLAVFTSCGSGGRTDPSKITTGDFFDTTNDGLARICRAELRKVGVGAGVIRCVFSTELPVEPVARQRQESGGRDRALNGTISYMPPMFGLTLASLVLRHVLDPGDWRRWKKKRQRLEERGAGGGGGGGNAKDTS